MGIIHYISADGTSRSEEAKAVPDREACERYLGGDRELVWVLFEGKRTGMFVNENGIALGLPINESATTIYRAWPISQGMNVTGRHIHGNVIVLEDIRVN